MGVAYIRKSQFSLRRQAQVQEGVVDRCLYCVHYQPWRFANPDRVQKKQDGTCALLGGWVHQWTVCNKYRGA